MMKPTPLWSAALVTILAGSDAFAQPVARWSFETPGERVEDSSGNGHDGRATDCTWAQLATLPGAPRLHR
jgi:hypothetical protein